MPNLSNIIGLGVATIFLAAIVGYAVWRGLAAIRRVGTFFLIFAVGMAFYGGSKGFRPVQFPLTDMEVAYLTDSGSRVTSNAVHLAFSASAMMPSDAEIYLDYRDAESTNDADWVTYTNATLATFPNPLDFEFPDAISNVWQCYTTWTPGAIVLTNGIVRIGWMLPTDGSTNTVLMLRTAVKTPTAADMPQEDLVEMWDGIENVAWGVHDETATNWVGLVRGITIAKWSNNSKRYQNPFPAKFEADCLHMATNDTVTLAGAYLNVYDSDARTILGYGTDDYVYKDMEISNHWAITTRELIYIEEAGDHDQPILQWANNGNGPGGKVWARYGSIRLLAGLRTGGNPIEIIVCPTNNNVLLDLGVVFENVPQFVDGVFKGRVAKSRFYVNGKLKGTFDTVRENYTGSIANKPLIANIASHYVRGFHINKSDWQGSPWSPNMRIYNMATWKRALTDEEFAYIHDLDRARFKLPHTNP